MVGDIKSERWARSFRNGGRHRAESALVAYAEILARQTGQPVSDPTKVIVAMLARFMATDRAFAKAQKLRQDGNR
jgi:hypothetical protein